MLAHIENSSGEVREQSVAEHTYGVMVNARMEGEKLHIGNIVMLAALFHDMGKEKKEFEEYLYSQFQETGKQSRGSVNHSSAGARYIFRNYHKGRTIEKVFTELIAYAIASHHGLFDIIEESGLNHFSKRIEESETFQECCDNFTKEVLCNYDVDQLFEQAFEEFRFIVKKVKGFDQIHCKFYYGCFQRLVLSILMDSDWKDTEAFAGGKTVETVPMFEQLEAAISNYQSYMDKLQKQFSQEDSSEKQKQIMKLRNEIQKECVDFGKNMTGIYCLPIPTGGGKTLSGLGYALEFWKAHPETEKIFYISPYISITEQNARVIKEAIGESEWVLEHHSNVINESENETEQQASIFIKWDKPFICTTMVQFLNTLFSDKKQSIVRFHQLKNAVVIIDEVQSLPIKTVHTFNLMVNFLKEICNTNVVLCTATQPQLGDTKHPILYSTPKNMIQDVSERFEQFERVNIVSHLKDGEYDYEELRELTLNKLNERTSVLVILNTKYAVQMLYDAVMEHCDNNIEVVYLTTNLCAEHRTRKIKAIKKLLKEGKKKVLIVSTNLIEAGVDLSVECVIRSLAGLDSIAQAAGRCNRNGELKKGQVLIVSVKEEKKERMSELMSAIKATKDVLYRYEKEKGTNLLSPKWMNSYYEMLFAYNASSMDFSIRKLGGTNTIYSLLSSGFPTDSKETCMKQAYKTAGEYYNVIDQNGIDVIVPYGKGKDYISKLEQASELSEIKRILKKVQRYTVTVLQYKAKELEEKGVIRLCENVPGIYIAMSYDEHVGIVSELIELIF